MTCLFCAPPPEAHRGDGFLLMASLDPHTVAGWMVIAAERHVEGWDALSAAEARTLGDWIRRGVAAVKRECGAEKVYVTVFGEKVPHLHVHLFPRGAEVSVEKRGPGLLFEGVPACDPARARETARKIIAGFARG